MLFTGPPEQRFHSQPCWIKWKNRTDTEHQKQAGAAGGRVRAQQMKDTAKMLGYVKENGEHVHRVVAATLLGRALLPEEVVHHEDLNRQNNAASNLIVFPSQGVHARHHKLNHCGTPCDCPGIRLGVMPNAAP